GSDPTAGHPAGHHARLSAAHPAAPAGAIRRPILRDPGAVLEEPDYRGGPRLCPRDVSVARYRGARGQSDGNLPANPSPAWSRAADSAGGPGPDAPGHPG